MGIQQETWKKIAPRYEVSNFGQVRSLDRTTTDKRNREGFVRGRILSHGIRGDGYHVVNIVGFKHKKNWKVHQLVAFAFIPNPQNHPIINHKNGNKDDNSVENLEWCDYRHNNFHAFRVLKRKAVINCGSKNGFSKPILDKTTGIYFDCIKEASEAFNIKRRTLSAMLAGQSKNTTNLIYA